MEVIFTKQFFESLQDNWFTNTYHKIRSWFRANFNKEKRNLMKVCFRGRAWDYAYIYELEKAKLQEMIAYHEKNKRYVGVKTDIERMKLCVKLIDIFLENIDTYEYGGKMNFIPTEDGNEFKLDDKDLKYKSTVYVNMKNIKRFVPREEVKSLYEARPHELYILKAKALYHKIRTEQDFNWWD